MDIGEERIVIEPTKEEKDLGMEIMEFMQDLENIMETAEKIQQPRLRFDPLLFLLWRNANNRKA